MCQEKEYLTFKENLPLQEHKDFLQDYMRYHDSGPRKAKWATLFSFTPR